MNPESFKFKVITTGRQDVDKRRPSNLNPWSLEKLVKWINAQPLDEKIKLELVKSASAYPHQALGVWRKNYEKNLTIAQAKYQKIKPKVIVEEIEEKNLDIDLTLLDEFENPNGEII